MDRGHARRSAWTNATRLVIWAPEKACGKSRLMQLVRALCHRELIAVNVSSYAMYPAISQFEADPPTILLDEADTIFGARAARDEDLRGPARFSPLLARHGGARPATIGHTGLGGDMDPIVASGLTKAADASAGESAKVASNLLIRLLGPAADEYGDQLRQAVANRRAARAARILSKAESKSRGRAGSVSARVAYRVLEDGTLSDDELITEYLSGVLASSRTPGGRDDRAVTWSSLIARMSSIQLRAHYVLYREWAGSLRGRSDLNLGLQSDRAKSLLVADLDEFIEAVQDIEDPLDEDQTLDDALWGLHQHGLIGSLHYGPESEPGPRLASEQLLEKARQAIGTVERSTRPYTNVVSVVPTVIGIHLWGWAGGMPGMSTDDFVGNAPTITTDPEIQRLATAVLPRLLDDVHPSSEQAETPSSPTERDTDGPKLGS